MSGMQTSNLLISNSHANYNPVQFSNEGQDVAKRKGMLTFFKKNPKRAKKKLSNTFYDNQDIYGTTTDLSYNNINRTSTNNVMLKVSQLSRSGSFN